MNKMDLSDWFIIAFVATIFFIGAITIYKFMRKK